MPRPNRHNEIELNLLSAGSLTYLLGGDRTTIQAGRLAVFWAAIPHQIVDFNGDAPYFVVTLPLIDFLQSTQDVTFVNRILCGELVLDPSSDDCDPLRFQQWECDLREQDPASGTAARLEIQARLIRLARSLGNCSSHSRPAANLTRADQIACFIARHYPEPLTAQSIADAVGVHSNYAMSLFRETFGTTITSFITQHRISHAQRLLVTSEESILSIAMSAGFQSLSRFNEAFRKMCGCSPRDFRKSHRIQARESGMIRQR